MAITESTGAIEVLDHEEGRRLFDEAAQQYLHMSGEEFLRRWDAGAFADDADRPEVMAVVMLLPFVR
jgi:hypothetical protein